MTIRKRIPNKIKSQYLEFGPEEKNISKQASIHKIFRTEILANCVVKKAETICAIIKTEKPSKKLEDYQSLKQIK